MGKDNKKILVVDDEEKIVDVVKSYNDKPLAANVESRLPSAFKRRTGT